MYLNLNKDDIVLYHGNKPYILANGQIIEGEGELIIRSNVKVQKKYFSLKEKKIEKVKQVKDKTLDEMNKEELLNFADKNNIDVDNRKGEKKLREEIKAKMN